MTIQEFAEQYRVRRVNTGAEWIVPGKYGELAAFAEDDFRLRLLAVPRNRVMTGALLNRRRAALAGGLRLKLRADAESIFYFDPLDAREAALAIRLVGAKRRRTGRTPTPEQRERFVQMAAARRNPDQNERTETRNALDYSQ